MDGAYTATTERNRKMGSRNRLRAVVSLPHLVTFLLAMVAARFDCSGLWKKVEGAKKRAGAPALCGESGESDQ